MNPFTKRKINVTFILGKGAFGDDKGDEVTVSGLRVAATILAYSGEMQGRLQLSIFGLPLSMINQLTTIGPVMVDRKNNMIIVEAGDEGGKMSVSYKGYIETAYADFQGAPEVVFNIIALSMSLPAVKPVKARSYKGSVDAAQILAEIAKSAKLEFVNNGVSVMLTDMTYSGTDWTQIKEVAWDANIEYAVDRGTLSIWPKKKRKKGEPIKVSSATGMVGYPTFSSQGIIVTTLFNSEIALGAQIDLDTTLTPAKGIWNVFAVTHNIESEMPNGPWFTYFQCQRTEESK